MDAEKYMREAIVLSKIAAENGETPVGCVIVDENGVIVGRGYNRVEEMDSTCHAELMAIRDAAKNTGSWRLNGKTMFVTMEPCPMCAGGILLSRISTLYYGVKDDKLGSCGSVINLFMENYGRSPAVYGGLLADECAKVLSDFFKSIRKQP